MELRCLIYFAFFVVQGFSAEQDDEENKTNKSDLENRWNFYEVWDSREPSSCITGFSDPGFCVPLRRCPELFNQVRHLHPGRVFENLQEFTNPCSIQAQVCCPERRNMGPPPIPLQQHHHHWSWTTALPVWPPRNPSTEITPPSKMPTTMTPSTRWSTSKPKNPMKEPSISVPPIYKNRKLLPEDSCGVTLGKRIVGGDETDLEDHPWMALLRMRLPKSGQTAFVCGGTLISTLYVLTAAHCMKGTGIPKGAVVDSVRLGEHNTRTTADCARNKCTASSVQDIPVQERFIHSEFTPNHPGTYNDIALLRLKHHAKLNLYIQPACLPFDGFSTTQFNGRRLTTVGWGKTASGPQAKNSQVKRRVQVPVVPFGPCAEIYLKNGIQLRDTQMCAGGEEGKDSCQGDSGGPILSEERVGQENRWFLQGVVSTGPKECGKFGMPALYTKISKYLVWIMDNIRE